MCGHAVAVKPAPEPEYAVTRMPAQEIASTSNSKVERPAGVNWEPVEPRREAKEVREPEPIAAEPAKRSDKWWVEDGDTETTVGGPSFLGLSSAESGSGGYSYLFQEEEERSHKAGWVLLVVLLVLGGVVYAKWQPLRDYVLTTAISNSRPKQPAPTENNAEAAPPASNAPTTTLASSDTQAPPITTENNADQKKAAEPKTSDSKEGLPERDKESADNSNVGAKGAGKQAEKRPAAVKDEAPADTDETPAEDEEKPSAAKRGVVAPANEGGELVNSGERYLYGRGVARSCDQAVSYFNAAAAKQNPQAFSHLGALYATGQCVPMDRAVAYAWFRRAYTKEPGNHYFEQNLTMLWREMTPGERQRATGRQ
jgi:hypothetical protein